MDKIKAIKGSILGACVGDMLGVPFEFRPKEYVQKRNILNHSEKGYHKQPEGTWSDDSSMIFCTMESLCRGYDIKDMGNTFVKWSDESYWTANGNVFDIGRTTREAIDLIKNKNIYSGLKKENDCGNGSLMRIIPLLFYIDNHRYERFKIIEEVSSLTHAHITCTVGCAIFIEFALNILDGQSKEDAYLNMQNTIEDVYEDYPEILNKYQKILYTKIWTLDEELFKATGYIVNTLEVVMYSFFSTFDYINCVCHAISFGDDTDTTACIVGALAGLYYGVESIPKDIIKKVLRLDDILDLILRFSNNLK